MTTDERVAQYDKMYRDRPERWISPRRNAFAITALGRYGAPKLLLDIGCGSGHTIAYLKQYWPNTEYYGVDLSGEALKLARERVPDAKFVQGKLETMKMDKKFDLILLMGVVEHFPDLPLALDKIHKLKTKNGRVYIETPDKLDYLGSSAEGWFEGDDAEQSEWRYTHKTWERVLQDNGFTIKDRHLGGHWTHKFVWVVQ